MFALLARVTLWSSASGGAGRRGGWLRSAPRTIERRADGQDKEPIDRHAHVARRRLLGRGLHQAQITHDRAIELAFVAWLEGQDRGQKRDEHGLARALPDRRALVD